MTILQNITFRCAFFISLAFTSAVCLAADTKKSSPEDFIRSLYHFHQPGKDTPDWFGDKQTLSKYFDKELTALFIKDDECQKREQDVCNLDFDPIYDAQDFDDKTTNLQIAAVVGQPDLFNVTFTNLGTRTLVYRLTNTSSGWQISDIKYPEGPSLKEILSGKSESAGGDEARSINRDRDALVALENEWLKNEHNTAELEHILASDFLHPVVTGDLLTKAQHIEFSSKHLLPADLTNRFEGLQVRIYGDVGIVNGLVVTTNKDGNTVDKTVFTDVFVYRDGRWQAVNAQENKVKEVDNSH